ncbi:hypothetical protein CK203_075727 [Vitis vinifera]|uniref:Endonuclease/exonuclease/phosphatase domain-containing protein n=1 Tax=Vitis vinifera TaxID=29760 RepID=A0A438F7B7_VITVI|nr:hypothetical protein CK203_075727 [Vitis vinifera]
MKKGAGTSRFTKMETCLRERRVMRTNGTDLAIVPFGGVLESPLVETMALQVEVGDEEEVWSSSCLAKFSHCLGMPTVGFEEEILYLFEKNEGRIEKKNQGGRRDFFSVMSVQDSMDGMRWVFTGVYGRYPEERSRGGELSASMRRFTEVVEDLELRDYPYRGMFNGAMQGILARSVSDHFPILLRVEFIFTGSLSFVLDAKLRALKGLLKTWNKEVFGVIETKKREALSQVVYWMQWRIIQTLSLEDCEARKEAQEAYKTWVLREEKFLGDRDQGNCG